MALARIHTKALIPAEQAVYTAYCSLPDTPRGQYDEEIDLVATRPYRRPGITEIRRVAQAELDANYEPGMRVRRIRRIS